MCNFAKGHFRAGSTIMIMWHCLKYKPYETGHFYVWFCQEWFGVWSFGAAGAHLRSTAQWRTHPLHICLHHLTTSQHLYIGYTFGSQKFPIKAALPQTNWKSLVWETQNLCVPTPLFTILSGPARRLLWESLQKELPNPCWCCCCCCCLVLILPWVLGQCPSHLAPHHHHHPHHLRQSYQVSPPQASIIQHHPWIHSWLFSMSQAWYTTWSDKAPLWRIVSTHWRANSEILIPPYQGRAWQSASRHA